MPSNISLELESYFSADIETVWEWIPTDPAEVFFHLGLDIGERGKRGATHFQAVIATPEGIQATYDRYGIRGIPNRNLLVFCDYSWEVVMDRIAEILKACESNTLGKSYLKLNRYFFWEYEDYQGES